MNALRNAHFVWVRKTGGTSTVSSMLSDYGTLLSTVKFRVNGKLILTLELNDRGEFTSWQVTRHAFNSYLKRVAFWDQHKHLDPTDFLDLWNQENP